MALILIVEDEKLLRWSLQEQLKRAGNIVHEAENLEAATRHLEGHQPEVVLLDLSLPDGHGLDFYEKNRSRLDGSAVIIMTALGQVEEAVRAMKLGAVDFLTKPVNQKELLELVDRSLTERSDHLEAQAARQKRERSLKQDLIAESPLFRKVLSISAEVGESEVNSILIQGESGTGKNVIARYIHSASRRREKPILEVSCAAIPDNLLESELFGHERGAFTDAKSMRRGSFELADGGTVVLDEVGELKAELQAKLLHVLEERRFRRVGGTREILADIQVIALTNRNLAAMVEGGQFRSDLFYRLNVFPITVPTLKERLEDILPLAKYFLNTGKIRLCKNYRGFTREAETQLLGYSWPGNVRELRNVIERAMVLERGEQISIDSLILDRVGEVREGTGGGGSERGENGQSVELGSLAEMERTMVVNAMRAAGNNQTKAADLLEITRDQLRYRLKKFEIGSG